jgi:DNA-binding transcriptional ArsR family regulator
MGNNSVFKALSSSTRIKIMKMLMNKEIHISELARDLGISIPVTSKHVKILENVGLVKKRVVGNIHLLSVNVENLEDVLNPFVVESKVEINKNDSLLDALKQIPGIEFKEVAGKQYITSIDGEKGYYIYEVDDVYPKVPIDEYRLKKNVTLRLKKLVPIDKKKIKVKIPKQ